MPGMSGIELFQKLHKQNPLLPVIILTAHGTIPDAVSATQAGVFSYLTKPFDSNVLLKHIETALQNAVKNTAINAKKINKASNKQQNDWRSNIVTQNAEMEKLCQQIEKIAPTSASVLIQGNSGTGKELIARAVHEASNRSGPFTIINCNNIGDQFNQSHFTESTKGTLFLDEISDLSLSSQKTLLLILLENKLNKDTNQQTRIVSTTQANLDDAVKQYKFRADLLYRLNAVTINIPSLEQRKEDILLIVNDWFNQHKNYKKFKFSRQAMQLLIKAEWPGNIRQLLHVAEQCCMLSTTNIISDTLVATILGSSNSQIQPLSIAHADFERDYIISLLKLTNGNVTHAADLAKRNRTEFHRLLKKHQIEAKLFR